MFKSCKPNIQLWRVCLYGSRSDQNGVCPRTFNVAMRARDITRNPPAAAIRRGDLTIQRCRDFQRYKWPPQLHAAQKSGEAFARFSRHDASFDSDARGWLANKGYDKLYGARPMARLIQEKIKQPLAEELLFGKLSEGGEVHVSIKDGKPAFEMTPAPPKVKPEKKASAKRKPAKKPETETDEG